MEVVGEEKNNHNEAVEEGPDPRDYHRTAEAKKTSGTLTRSWTES